MKQLIEMGLAGRGLTRVSTAPLVARYNAALAALGVEPTKLDAFFIDGMGWSPEIATEKGNKNYLLDGSSHQFAIILSPDQKNKPIYVPYVSFERRLMHTYFAQFEAQIADITSTEALVLDIDAEVLRYQSPRDLLLVDDVVARSQAGALIGAAAEQRRLVKEILDEPEAWTDANRRDALIKNAADHGDLRKRNVDIGDFRFKDIGSFYTEAFGGVFLFRLKQSRLLVLCDENECQNLTGIPGTEVLPLASKVLPELLRSRRLVDLNLENRESTIRRLEDIGNCLTANYVFQADPGCKWETLTDVRRRRLVGALPPEQTELLRELELLRRTLASSHMPMPNVNSLSPELQLLLLQPTPGFLTSAQKETIVLLLARLRSHDPLELYTADKNRFFVSFKDWPESKQRYAVDRIAKRYKAVMDEK